MIDFSEEARERARVVQYQTLAGGEYMEFEVDANGNVISREEGLRVVEPFEPGLEDLDYTENVSIEDVWDMIDGRGDWDEGE